MGAIILDAEKAKAYAIPNLTKAQNFLNQAYATCTTLKYSLPTSFSKRSSIESISRLIDSTRKDLNSITKTIEEKIDKLNAVEKSRASKAKAIGVLAGKLGNLDNKYKQVSALEKDAANTKSSYSTGAKISKSNPVILDTSEKEEEEENTFKHVMDRTGASIANGFVSLLKGVTGVVEATVDAAALIVTAGATVITGATDLIYSAATGKWDDWGATKELWKGTKSFVTTQYNNKLYDAFYKNTKFGQDLDNLSYAPFKSDGIGSKILSGVGYVAGEIVLTVATLGTAAPLTLAATAGVTGLGKYTEEEWNKNTMSVNYNGQDVDLTIDYEKYKEIENLKTGNVTEVKDEKTGTTFKVKSNGNGKYEIEDSNGISANLNNLKESDTAKGLAIGTLKGGWEFAQWYAGGKINTLFKGANSVITNRGVASLARVGLDTLTSVAEVPFQSAVTAISEDKSYGKAWKENGGWESVLTQTALGALTSGFGEGMDFISSTNATKNILSALNNQSEQTDQVIAKELTKMTDLDVKKLLDNLDDEASINILKNMDPERLKNFEKHIAEGSLSDLDDTVPVEMFDQDSVVRDSVGDLDTENVKISELFDPNSTLTEERINEIVSFINSKPKVDIEANSLDDIPIEVLEEIKSLSDVKFKIENQILSSKQAYTLKSININGGINIIKNSPIDFYIQNLEKFRKSGINYTEFAKEFNIEFEKYGKEQFRKTLINYLSKENSNMNFYIDNKQILDDMGIDLEKFITQCSASDMKFLKNDPVQFYIENMQKLRNNGLDYTGFAKKFNIDLNKHNINEFNAKLGSYISERPVDFYLDNMETLTEMGLDFDDFVKQFNIDIHKYGVEDALLAAKLYNDKNIFFMVKLDDYDFVKKINSADIKKIQEIIGVGYNSQIDSSKLESVLKKYLTPDEISVLSTIKHSGKMNLNNQEYATLFQYQAAGGCEIARYRRGDYSINLEKHQVKMNNYQIKKGTGVLRKIEEGNSKILEEIDSAIDKNLNSQVITGVRYCTGVGPEIDLTPYLNGNADIQDLVGLSYNDLANTSYTILHNKLTSYARNAENTVKIESVIEKNTGAFIESSGGIPQYKLMEFLTKNNTKSTIVGTYWDKDGRLVLQTLVRPN